MAWYVNDLSLNGQYPTASDFTKDLTNLMRERQGIEILARELFCSRDFHTRPVTATENFREAVRTDKNLVQPVLAWLTKNGPFWDDDRQANPNDYFEYQGQDVTDQGLGEAARRILTGKVCSSISFPNKNFSTSPLNIVHGLVEAPLGAVSIENIWDFSLLRNSALTRIPQPINWIQMFQRAQVAFDRLEFHPCCIDSLKMEPFSVYVVERVFELLGVLNEFMKCRNNDGTYSDKNDELIDMHFSGEKAWFTDESESNKRDFKQKMTFPDHENLGKKVFCSWHGKIKTPQYRIHFEWPLQETDKLRIFYIGPKITKA